MSEISPPFLRVFFLSFVIHGCLVPVHTGIVCLHCDLHSLEAQVSFNAFSHTQQTGHPLDGRRYTMKTPRCSSSFVTLKNAAKGSSRKPRCVCVTFNSMTIK